jgi:hypothetical protein
MCSLSFNTKISESFKSRNRDQKDKFRDLFQWPNKYSTSKSSYLILRIVIIIYDPDFSITMQVSFKQLLY